MSTRNGVGGAGGRRPKDGSELHGLSAREANVVAEHRKRVEMEVLGEAVITAKHQSIEFDRKRQTNREALAAIRRLDPTPSASGKGGYVCSQVFLLCVSVSTIAHGCMWSCFSLFLTSPHPTSPHLTSSHSLECIFAFEELYYCIGDLFVKVPRSLVEKQIRIEQQQIDEEMDVLRTDMKQQMSQLAELEGDPRAGVRPFKELSGVHPSQLHSSVRRQ
jgi:hypothetical protein